MSSSLRLAEAARALAEAGDLEQLLPKLLKGLAGNGQPIELSTGLFTTDRESPAGSVWNDARGARGYTHEVEDYAPDHLAILPDQRSFADGKMLRIP